MRHKEGRAYKVRDRNFMNDNKEDSDTAGKIPAVSFGLLTISIGISQVWENLMRDDKSMNKCQEHLYQKALPNYPCNRIHQRFLLCLFSLLLLKI